MKTRNTEREGSSVCLCAVFLFNFFASALDPQAKAPDMVDEMLAVHCLFDEVTVPLDSYEFTFRFFCRSVSCIVCRQCPTMFQMKENVTGF